VYALSNECSRRAERKESAKSMRKVETRAGFGSLQTMKGNLIDKIKSKKALDKKASAKSDSLR
jgi:hypothetical protein